MREWLQAVRWTVLERMKKDESRVAESSSFGMHRVMV